MTMTRIVAVTVAIVFIALVICLMWSHQCMQATQDKVENLSDSLDQLQSDFARMQSALWPNAVNTCVSGDLCNLPDDMRVFSEHN